MKKVMSTVIVAIILLIVVVPVSAEELYGGQKSFEYIQRTSDGRLEMITIPCDTAGLEIRVDTYLQSTGQIVQLIYILIRNCLKVK